MYSGSTCFNNSEMAGVVDQSEEISAFKAEYDGNVRVIKDVGDFTHVVTVQRADQDLYCKFQLTASYPDSAPTINIRSDVVPGDLLVTLTSDLEKLAKANLGKPMIKTIVEAIEKWVKNCDLDLTPHVEVKETKGGKGGRGRGKQRKNANKSKEMEDEDGMSEKKSSMKTAADVIKRLQWDKDLPVEYFIVGYIDRFTGIVENSFTDFSWEDLASVDQFSLAIPQHRIQYFKYKTEKIWDKNERLDNVFGSTGSKMTITDVIQNYQVKVGQSQDDQLDMEGACGTERDDHCNFDLKSLSVEIESENVRISRESKKKPDYFLALRITDDEVVERCKELQEAVIRHYPHFAPHKIVPHGFHLTLSLLCLEGQENVRKCVDLLEREQARITQLARASAPLEMVGVDHFNNYKVIYAKVKCSKEFLQFVDTLKLICTTNGLHIKQDYHGFNPHITLFKVNRAAGRSRDWPKETLSLASLSDNIGTQAVDNLHLCQMGTLDDDSSDFYKVAASFSFVE